MIRRDFIKGACGLCGVALVSGLVESCQKNNVTPKKNFTIDLSNSSNSSLNSVGGSLVQNGVIIVHTSNGYVAFSDSCTHQGCSVNYSSSSNKFICPCHSGEFDINGNVVAGPPPSALPKYNTSLNGNILTISS